MEGTLFDKRLKVNKGWENVTIVSEEPSSDRAHYSYGPTGTKLFRLLEKKLRSFVDKQKIITSA